MLISPNLTAGGPIQPETGIASQKTIQLSIRRSITTAVILAAGKGTRLLPITRDRSKAMLPLAGEPIVERVMKTLTAYGIHEFILVVRSDDQHIIPYFQSVSKIEAKIHFVLQHETRGMAHALGCASSLIKGDFILSACDNLVSTLDMGRLINAWDTAPYPTAVLCLMFVEEEKTNTTGIVSIKDGWVNRIIEKPTSDQLHNFRYSIVSDDLEYRGLSIIPQGDTNTHPRYLASLPLYCFPSRILDYLSKLTLSTRGELELQDAIQQLIDQDGQVRGVLVTQRLTVTNPIDLITLNRLVQSNSKEFFMSKQIAFIAYETPFAPTGGIAAVMGRLSESVRKASGIPTIVVTPYHFKNPRTTAILDETELVGGIGVPFSDQLIPVKILRVERNGTWYFLQAEDDRFFAGVRHPYDIGSTELLRDSLFFGAAVARALPVIASEASWDVMMQDWEAATTALALVGQPQMADCKLFLTLHNSYDCGVTDSILMDFKIDPALCPGETILQRALPLVRDPVFTVSDQFARDFTEEVLQAEVMAPHLKDILAPRLVGIANGLFADLALAPSALISAERGDFKEIQEWKVANRIKAVAALDAFQPSPDKPVWGDINQFKHVNPIWFVLAGRDDPRQKGYDVACNAITNFLILGGEACFLFFPIPGDEGLEGLGFLKRLAERFPESVLVLPFLFKEGYLAALSSATYGIMSSLYEPFGMANEFYMNGTVGIGRATGGICQQIIPLRSSAAFSHAVQQRTDRYFGASSRPTGILFRERDGIPTAISDWKGINDGDYKKGGGSPDRVEQRQAYVTFRSMVDELLLALQDSVRIYHQHPDLYYQMLVDGIVFLRNSFSWERTAQDYTRYLR